MILEKNVPTWGPWPVPRPVEGAQALQPQPTAPFRTKAGEKSGPANYVTFGIILLLFFSCISTQKNLPEPAETQAENGTAELSQSSGMVSPQSYEEIACHRFGDNVDFHINEPGTHVLCVRRPRRDKTPIPVFTSRTKFFVFDLSGREILFEDSLENARVFWEDETHVKVLVTPGIVQGVVPMEYGYRYDVVSGRKELLGIQ